MSAHRTAAEVRREIDHPVIDADGHLLEVRPIVGEFVRELGGAAYADKFADASNDRKFHVGGKSFAWWGTPRDARDRATAFVPKLLHERLPELGFDYAIVYPTQGLGTARTADPDERDVLIRAYNTYYREAIRLGPDDYRNRLAMFFGASSTFTPEASQRIELSAEESVRCLGDAARLVPSADFDGLYLLGISYQSIDSLETALEFLLRGAEVRPGDERVVLNLASVLEKLKRYEEAEKHLAALHARQPDDPTTCNFYGYLLALMGKDLDKAEELIKKALEGEPQNGYYIDSLGWVFFTRGEYRRAVEELERAAAIAGNDPVILEHLGDAYNAVGRYREALDAYEKSKSIEDGREEVDRKIHATRKKVSG